MVSPASTTDMALQPSARSKSVDRFLPRPCLICDLPKTEIRHGFKTYLVKKNRSQLTECLEAKRLVEVQSPLVAIDDCELYVGSTAGERFSDN